jgi:hypothetical protein
MTAKRKPKKAALVLTDDDRRPATFAPVAGEAGHRRSSRLKPKAEAGWDLLSKTWNVVKVTSEISSSRSEIPCVTPAFKSVLQCALGYPRQSIQTEHDAISLARRLKHVPSLAHALWFVCQAQIVRNDAHAALKTAHELLALSEEHGLPQTRAAALVYLGWAMGQADDALAGIQRVEQGLTKFNQLGVRTNLCLMMCLSAET